jgi:hypothetical protein
LRPVPLGGVFYNNRRDDCRAARPRGRAALEAHEAGDAILLFTIFSGNARLQTIVKMTQDSKRAYFTRYKFD